ncbi:MAG: helix-turn-helix domain-containing protein [Alcaligenaceae bacterium]|nr:helix-turn-helix domain-containing protein [Alcaligenaceae bacterium]
MSHISSALTPCTSSTVALLVYKGIGSLNLSGPLMVFGRNGIHEPPANLFVCAEQPEQVGASLGLDFGVPHGLDKLDQADAIIVPGWIGVDEPVPEILAHALRRAHARKAQIMGLCLGVFVLAEAGLLDGRRATTHWLRSEIFAERYPHVRLDMSVLYARDDHIWTSAGGAAGLNACLQLLQELKGTATANQVARLLVARPVHHDKQLPHNENTDVYQDATKRLHQLLDWIPTHLDEAQRLDVLAERVHMTVRTFTRRFRLLTGTTVVQWRLNQQLKRARQLLETSDATMETIASQTGFGSALSLRKHFKKAIGVPPSAYRKRSLEGPCHAQSRNACHLN